MDDDTISRQAAIDKVDRIVEVNHLNPDMVWFTPNGVKTLMEDLPSAQPERIRGRWIEKPHVHGVAYCSLCEYELHTNDTNFCPNCGAKMEVGENAD